MNFLQCAELGDCAGVAHGFFTRHGGVSRGIYASLNCGLGSRDEPGRVVRNLARVAAAMAVPPARLVTLRQTHSAEVCVLDGAVPAQRPAADALVTATPGIALGITGADCPTVLLADAASRVVGAAHAGWRGAHGGVLEATLLRMLELGARPERISAAIGPGIQQPSYEVGAAFRAQFLRDDTDCADLFSAGEQCHFDLPGYIARRLRRAGIGSIEQRIEDTFSDERLFSYRRSGQRGEADYGRLLGVICLQPG